MENHNDISKKDDWGAPSGGKSAMEVAMVPENQNIKSEIIIKIMKGKVSLQLDILLKWQQLWHQINIKFVLRKIRGVLQWVYHSWWLIQHKKMVKLNYQ